MREDTTRIEFATLLCTPEVIRSKSWPELEESQARTWTWIRFWRKSPARGLIERQSPVESLIWTEEKARTAVLSRGLASAAAEGLRTPPAPETGTADVGLAVNTAPAAAAAEEMGAEVMMDETREDAAMVFADEPEERVMFIMVVGVKLVDGEVEAASSATAEETGVELAAIATAVVEARTEAALPPPKVNDWVESPEHGASSRTLADVTARQVPTAFRGLNASGPAPPVKLKSWEFVTAPPPSPRPPQENMMTVLPAARRGSKFKHA